MKREELKIGDCVTFRLFDNENNKGAVLGKGRIVQIAGDGCRLKLLQDYFLNSYINYKDGEISFTIWWPNILGLLDSLSRPMEDLTERNLIVET